MSVDLQLQCSLGYFCINNDNIIVDLLFGQWKVVHSNKARIGPATTFLRENVNCEKS